MAATYEQICDYHAKLSRHEDPILLRMEEEARNERFPIIGPAAGKFCYLMARAINAKRIFELGSGYGYSTLWFARAVRENGTARMLSPYVITSYKICGTSYDRHVPMRVDQKT